MIRKLNRRTAIKTGLGAAVATPALLSWAKSWASENLYTPEAGAELRMLRWNRFVESEDIAFDAIIAAFTEATGVPIKLDKEFLDDIQPKAAVAANVGAGPDIIWGTMAIPQLIPDKLLDLTDVAEDLAGRYGGWYDMPKKYSFRDGKWIALPLAISGNYVNFRVSALQEAGFDKFPADTDGFLKLATELNKIGKPGGMALGHATGDANAWTHWLLWAFGGRLVDEENNVAINSPETIAALEYVQELYEQFIPGTASWNDSNNNKAFLSGGLGFTNNGISIYAAAVRDGNPIADDMDHAFYPIGPAGVPTELQLPFPVFAFQYTKYPDACKALLSYLHEAQQYNFWLQESVGYFTQVLKDYETHPVFDEDPKRMVFRQAATRSLDIGHAGDLGFAAAQALADFIVVDMVAAAATGQQTPAEAAEFAERRAERYYRI